MHPCWLLAASASRAVCYLALTFAPQVQEPTYAAEQRHRVTQMEGKVCSDLLALPATAEHCRGWPLPSSAHSPNWQNWHRPAHRSARRRHRLVYELPDFGAACLRVRQLRWCYSRAAGRTTWLGASFHPQ